MKPLNHKNYGSIPHLLGSKLGKGDYHIHEGQHNIMTLNPRDKYDNIIVTEKYDGSNVGVCKVNGKIHAITRAGYLASTSQYIQHQYFDEYVKKHYKRFNDILHEGERLVGEWMLTICSLPYNIDNNDPFIAFDLFQGKERRLFEEMEYMCLHCDTNIVRLLHHSNESIDIEKAKSLLALKSSNDIYTENPEGLVYRVERKSKVDFLAKWVRNDFNPGECLFGETMYNINPNDMI